MCWLINGIMLLCAVISSPGDGMKTCYIASHRFSFRHSFFLLFYLANMIYPEFVYLFVETKAKTRSDEEWKIARR